MKRTCIFQDTERMDNTTGLLEAAGRLHGKGAFESYLVLLDDLAEFSGNDFPSLFHHVIQISRGLVNGWDARAMTEVLETLHRRYCFDSILIPATSLGKMVAPRLAKRLETVLVSGVTDIKRQKDVLEIIRPACSGKIVESVRFSGPEPVIMSIRPNAFDYSVDASAGARVQTEIFEYNEPVTFRSNIKRIQVEKIEQTLDNDIRDYDVLISGGGGVKDLFLELFRLAEALNGTVAASRKLVDQGIAPRAIQVGQSGKMVSPRLYMALGIHGSMQHLAGLRQAEIIISVNTAGHAPICSLSDIVVHGDAGEFITRLMDKISNYRSENIGKLI